MGSAFVEGLEFSARVPGGAAHVRVVRIDQKDGPGAWRAEVVADGPNLRRDVAAYAHGPTAEAALRALSSAVRGGADFVERLADAVADRVEAPVSTRTVLVGGVLVDVESFVASAADDVNDALKRGDGGEIDEAAHRLAYAVSLLRAKPIES